MDSGIGPSFGQTPNKSNNYPTSASTPYYEDSAAHGLDESTIYDNITQRKPKSKPPPRPSYQPLTPKHDDPLTPKHDDDDDDDDESDSKDNDDEIEGEHTEL
jgi:hypothetical protein